MPSISIRVLILIFVFINFNCNLVISQNIPSLIESLEHYSKKNNYPGVMLSIVKSDTILFSDGIGYASIEDSIRVNNRQLFRQGSISKSFISLALIKILNEKHLSLQTPIKQIDNEIPFINHWSDTTPITVAHLLESSSGFDDFHAHAVYNFTDSIAPETKKMVQSHKNSLYTRWEPGSRHAYSNSGYVVAGHLIEKLSGIPYQEYIKNEILVPLNMKTAGFYFKPPTDLPFASGYSFQNSEFKKVPFASLQSGPAGDLCSNAYDMGKYLQFMLKREGELIDSLLFTSKTFNRIENSKATIAGKLGLEGGYGLGNFSVWQNGHLFHGHDGAIDGYSSRYIYSKEADLGIAIAVNITKDPTPMVEIILDSLLTQTEASSIKRKTFSIPDSLKRKYEGFYVFKNPRQEFKSFINGIANHFILKFNNNEVYIKSIFGDTIDVMNYAEKNKFYRNTENIPSVLMFDNNQQEAVVIKRNYAEKESMFLRMTKNVFIVLSVITPFIYMLYFGLMLVIQIVKRKTLLNWKNLLLFLACLCFPLMFYGFTTAASARFTAGDFTFHSALFCISSILMVILTLVSVYFVFSSKQKKLYNLIHKLTTLFMVILCIFLWDSGFIGMRLWAY